MAPDMLKGQKSGSTNVICPTSLCSIPGIIPQKVLDTGSISGLDICIFLRTLMVMIVNELTPRMRMPCTQALPIMSIRLTGSFRIGAVFWTIFFVKDDGHMCPLVSGRDVSGPYG